MTTPLSPSAARVQAALRALGQDIEVMEFSESTRTAEEAARRAGCTVGQIVKSMIFRGVQSGKAILVLTSGANRVNERALASHVGEDVARPDAVFVRTSTGFAIGGVPPVGHGTPIDTYMDEDLLQYETVWASAGTPNAIFEVGPRILQEISRARVTRIK